MARPRKHIFNERYFETIDSPEKAYFLGFLFADGYNDQGYRHSIVVSVAKEDVETINSFQEATEPPAERT